MSELSKEYCVPCHGGEPPLERPAIDELLAELSGWALREEQGVPKLMREYSFKNFADALAFAVAVGDAAERNNHHPALLVEWGRVTVTWWTHATGGLHRNDFVMAAKCDEILSRQPGGR